MFGQNAIYNSPYTTSPYMTNTFQNPYMMPSSMQQIQQNAQMAQIAQNTTNQMNSQNNSFTGSIVSNFDEVRNYAIPATGSVLLLDVVNKRFYIKAMGQDGLPQIQTYTYDSVVSDRPNENLSAVGSESVNKIKGLEERVSKIETFLSGQSVENVEPAQKRTVKKEG